MKVTIYNTKQIINVLCQQILFGPNDKYGFFLNSHFLPALIRKIHNLKINKKSNLTIWGNGLAKREIIYVDDIADACVYFMKK